MLTILIFSFFSSTESFGWEEKNWIKKELVPFVSIKNQKNLKYVLPKDDKPGRALFDRPDVNDDYQIHFIYLLMKDDEDMEMDINGSLNQLVLEMNEHFNNLTKRTKKVKKSKGEGQHLKIDFTKDNLLDVTFLRLPWTKKEFIKKYTADGFEEKWPDNWLSKFMIQMGFHNTKKSYVSYLQTSFNQGESGAANLPHAFIYSKECKNNPKGQGSCMEIILHELMHTFGLIYPCNKGHSRGHLKGNDLMGEGVQFLDPKNKSYYMHDDESCPDLADVVYLTPTSENPWDPSDIVCKRQLDRFNHKKLLKHYKLRNFYIIIKY